MANLEQRTGDRRRASRGLSINTPLAGSSSSTYIRQPQPHHAQTYPPPEQSTGLPPASTYFVTSSGEDNTEPQPLYPDASSHFAYSTTLRRHHPDLSPTGPAFQNVAQGNWQKAFSAFAGGSASRTEAEHTVNGNGYGNGHANGLANGYADSHGPKATLSAKFSQSTIEVHHIMDVLN